MPAKAKLVLQTEEAKMVKLLVDTLIGDNPPPMIKGLLSGVNSALVTIDKNPQLQSKVAAALDLVKAQWRILPKDYPVDALGTSLAK